MRPGDQYCQRIIKIQNILKNKYLPKKLIENPNLGSSLVTVKITWSSSYSLINLFKSQYYLYIFKLLSYIFLTNFKTIYCGVFRKSIKMSETSLVKEHKNKKLNWSAMPFFKN